VDSVALGDLDGDCGLDVVSGDTGDYVTAWKNTTELVDSNRDGIPDCCQPVGGISEPVNTFVLVAPWIGLLALAGLAGLGTFALVRSRSA
jgi:hypothetical protein